MAARNRRAEPAAAVGAAALRLLGAPQLLLDGRAHPLERRDAALLALLALDGPLPRARAAAVVWPDADEPRARNNLRQRLFRLRRLAGRDVVDAAPLLRLAAGLRHDLADPGAQLQADDGAAAGELLGAFDYADCAELADWVAAARERWRSARREALAAAADRCEAEGRIAQALRYADRLAADEPLLEHAQRRLMRLHYLRGDRAAALAAFERARDLLARELGAQPGAETRELAALIERSGTLPAAARARPQPVAVLRPPRLVGREAVWLQLAQAAEAAGGAFVCGEPGIGKSRLLGDFAAAQGAAPPVAARPGDARLPYALLARLLRELAARHGAPEAGWLRAELARFLPELGAAPRAALDPLRLRQALAAAFAQWQAAGLALVALDDLQFADAATLELLPELAGAPQLAWLLGLRAAELPAALAAWLDDHGEDAPRRVDLAPLPAPAIAELLESLALPGLDAAAWAGPLARHTGGNPMFILETLRALLADGALPAAPRLPVPASIGPLIERRLAQLSAPALRLARVAALAGQDFSADLAAAVLGQHALDLAEAWRELEGAQVIRAQAFAHDLIFEATLRSVPAPIAASLHRDIAAHLLRAGAPPVRVARHFEQAGLPAQAAPEYERAAVQALRDSRRAEEARLLERAFDCYEQAGLADALFDCGDRLGAALLAATSYAQGEALAATLAQRAATPRQRLIALDLDASLYSDAHNDEAALARLRAARALAAELGEQGRQRRLAQREASVLGYLNRGAEGLALLAPLVAQLDRSGADPAAGELLCMYAGLLEFEGQLAEAVEALADAERLARADGDLTLLGSVLQVRAVCRHHLGRLEDAAADYDAARRLYSTSRGDEADGNFEEAGLARHWRDLGRFGDSLALCEAAIDAAARKGRDWVVAHAQVILAQTWIQLGQGARARRLLDAIATGVAANRLAILIHQAEMARLEGRSGRALIEEALQAAEQASRRERMRWSLGAKLCAELPADEAVARARQIYEEASARQIWSAALPALAQWTDALRRAGRARDAARQARVLGGVLRERAPVGMYAPEYRWIAYQAFKAAGERAEAVGVLRAALDWISQVALPTVPDEFKDSFLNRNPINRAILTTASQRQHG